MKTIVPNYYLQFNCIADKCKHTCCKGWEIEIDEDSLEKYKLFPNIAEHVDFQEHCYKLAEDESCPFLRQDGLCQQILDYNEDIICQICEDHPRFRNFWSDRVEIGLGLVCEEAARIILFSEESMQLVEIEGEDQDDLMWQEQEIDQDDIGLDQQDDPEETEALSDQQDIYLEESWLLNYRQQLLDNITEIGPKARLMEYLIFRHISDAIYDDRLEERQQFIQDSFDEITRAWEATDGSQDAMIEVVRQFSYDKEYNDEVEQ